MAHPRWIRRVFTAEDLTAISERVAAAEARTSAEIRVHLERHVSRSLLGKRHDALHRARRVFAHLGMHRPDTNAVLIYLALDDRKLAIVGSERVHARVGDDYWPRIRDGMVEHLRAGRAREAITTAIDDVGRVLAHHFPHRPGDTNRLDDAVSID